MGDNEVISFVNDEDEAECGCCNKTITATQKALLCDGCSFWHHIKCEKISEEIYVFPSDHQEKQSINWFCRKCTVTHIRLYKTVVKIEHDQKQLEDKIESVLEFIANTKPIEKDDVLNHLDQVLAKKTESHDIDTLKKCITRAMDRKMREEKEEEAERQKQITSAIVHGISESKEKESERRVDENE